MGKQSHSKNQYYPSFPKKERQTTRPLVSFVIVTFNSEKYIKKCLQSILKTAYSPFECIIMDNGSTDKTLELLADNFPKVKIYRNSKNSGYAGGCNLGVSYAKGEYIAIVTPDTEVSPNWLNPLLEEMKQSDVAACQPKAMLTGTPDLINLTGQTSHFLGFNWITDYRKRECSQTKQEITSFSGSLFLIKKLVFKEIGGFDESFFMYYEDGDFAWRIRSRGYKIIFVPQSTVYHDYKFNPDESYQKTRQKFYYLERNRLVMILKNYSAKTLLLLLPALLFMEAGMNIYFIARGWYSDKLKGYLWIIRHLKRILKTRKDIQKSRRLSDRKLSRNFKGKIEFAEFDNLALEFLVNPLLNSYWNITKKLI